MQQNRKTVLPAVRLGILVGPVIGYFVFGSNDVVRFIATVVTGALVGAIASSLRPERLPYDRERRLERWIQVALGLAFTATSVFFLRSLLLTGGVAFVPGIVCGAAGAIYFLTDPTRQTIAMMVSGLVALACMLAYFDTRSIACLVGSIFFTFCAMPLGWLVDKKR
jgi:uncharacterized membrane protein (UPF0136 family)